MRIYEDLRLVQTRLSLLQSIVVGLLALLSIHFWNLQVVRGRYFKTLAENNRSRTVSLAAPRGALLDRGGRILVENRPSFDVVLTPEHAESLDGTVARLARVLRMGEGQIRERLVRRDRPFRSVVKTFQVRVWRDLRDAWRGLAATDRAAVGRVLPDAGAFG